MSSVVRHRLLAMLALLSIGALASAFTGIAVAQTPVREIQVEGGDYYFKPKELTLTAGERVRIVFTNVSAIPHEFEISKLGATDVKWSGPADIPAEEKQSLDEHAGRGTPEIWVPAKGTGSVEFTPAKAGTFQMLCGIEGHTEAGMAGTVTVLAAASPGELPAAGWVPLGYLPLAAAGIGVVLGAAGLALRKWR